MSTLTDDGRPRGTSLSADATGRAGTGRSAWIGRALREPLLHFVVLGVLVFGGYRLIDRPPEASAGSQRIEITKDDLRQLAVVWLAQGREKPTPEQLRSLVDEKAAEEMLMREAIALGLDKNDEVVKRRLAQKMDFLLADIAALAPPTDDELTTWYTAHKAEFTKPPRIRFRHLYFSSDKRGANARAAAEASLPLVAGRTPASLAESDIADPFMFRDNYVDVTPEQMAKEFGGAFAQALFELRPGDWRGPVESGYGWHLVWIDSSEAPRVPTLEEVRPIVAQAWQAEKYREVKQRAMDEIRSRYAVIVPPLDNLNLDDLAVVPSDPGTLGGD
ncbi:peptidylprolyl isomerase [Chelatococcus asaccharovorans]|uniref:peptidylprolyl isomerase n=1 Tax=Chelatococcus asaccharovorans TaxID=28210 RepID=UPI00224C6ED0|nr:peptidylprolyl isomerase [Chelatococcus asaccharovorans]CAH1661043.1 Parvulin-like PPIase [Chelatococcus asaccharovorans]CAH1690065.1 Parvulin-like PPIase [Chelatococcus asaccharovorans]